MRNATFRITCKRDEDNSSNIGFSANLHNFYDVNKLLVVNESPYCLKAVNGLPGFDLYLNDTRLIQQPPENSYANPNASTQWDQEAPMRIFKGLAGIVRLKLANRNTREILYSSPVIVTPSDGALEYINEWYCDCINDFTDDNNYCREGDWDNKSCTYPNATTPLEAITSWLENAAARTDAAGNKRLFSDRYLTYVPNNEDIQESQNIWHKLYNKNAMSALLDDAPIYPQQSDKEPDEKQKTVIRYQCLKDIAAYLIHSIGLSEKVYVAQLESYYLEAASKQKCYLLCINGKVLDTNFGENKKLSLARLNKLVDDFSSVIDKLNNTSDTEITEKRNEYLDLPIYQCLDYLGIINTVLDKFS